MTEQRLYKIVVDKWPTDDGKPWPVFVDAVLPDDRPNETWLRRPQPWMWPLIYDDFSGMEEFVVSKGDDQYAEYEVLGWVLPSPTMGPKRSGRRYWHSRSAALNWIKAAAKWGAEAHLVASDPITWGED